MGTRLRVRTTVETTSATTTTLRKLTQKIPDPRGGPGLITTIYLDEGEYSIFRTLPGLDLVKSRFRVPPLSIDVFNGALEGLVIGEVEFGSDDERAAFREPGESIAEITHDGRLTGDLLATMERSTLLAILDTFGLAPLDGTELWDRPLSDLTELDFLPRRADL